MADYREAHDSRPILVIHPDRKAQRTVHRILGATLHAVDAADNLTQARRLMEQRSPALVVMAHHLLSEAGGVELVMAATKKGASGCLLLMNEAQADDLPRIFTTGSLTNLLGNPMPLMAEELTVTALKLLREDIFGLQKYLAWGIGIREHVVTSTDQRHELVDMLKQDVRALGLGPRIASMASLVTDELLSNALFNAPVDDHGRRTRHTDARDASRTLDEREQVTLRYACDARYLAIEVNDRFGSLTRPTVMDHLARTTQRGASHKVVETGAGAGMGLGLVYSCCNHLIFNLAPGQRTEIIGLIDVRYRPSELGNLVGSFNVFVREGGQA